MDFNLIFFLAGILIVGALMFGVICLFGKKGNKILDIEHYRARVLEIEHQLKQGDQPTYHLSVLNSDKLVDQALRDRGIKGKTMGERMKSYNDSFSDRNGIWAAHKIRNRIAHDSEASVSYSEARYALQNFRKALKDLGAI